MTQFTTSIPNVTVDEKNYVYVCGEPLAKQLSSYRLLTEGALRNLLKVTSNFYEAQFITCFLDRGRKITVDDVV